MAYIGNQVSSVPFIIDTFSGTGSATVFGQLTRAPAGVASIAVFISGVYKTPGVDYTLNGDLIVFTTPPASGTNNIVIHHMGNGSATSVPSDGSVTGAKLSSNVVRSNNIVAGVITSNHIAVGAITGNLIGVGAVSGNLIGTRAISGNQLSLYAVSGNNIGIGAISANNFAGGGITSNVLASNLNISVSRTLETATVNATAIGGTGNVNIDIVNNTVYLFTSAATANMQFNIRANTQNTFDSVTNIGQTTSVAIAVRGQTTRYTANLMIDTVRQTLNYAASQAPYYTASIASAEYNIYTYSIIKTAPATYAVFASNSLFGTA